MKLRECPFCGADAELQPRGNAWIAVCSRRFADNNLCAVNGRTRSGLTLEQAVETWNIRTVDPLITQLGEALTLLLSNWPQERDGMDYEILPAGVKAGREALAKYQEVKP